MPGVGGIMLWDCSWDQNNVIGGRYYHEYAYELLRGSITVPTGSPGTKPPIPPDTQAPQTRPPPTTRPPVGKAALVIKFEPKLN